MRTQTALLALGLALTALASACDRNVEPYQPGEEPRPPDLSRIFPGPPGGVGSSETGTAGNDAGQPARQALPPTRTGGAADGEGGDAPALAGPGIRGEVSLAAGATPPASGVLFVIARQEGARGGPPLAVLRIPEPRFPVAFEIGPQNVMIPTMRFVGPIALSARLDADGNAMTREPADLESPIVEPLSPGDGGVALELGGSTSG